MKTDWYNYGRFDADLNMDVIVNVEEVERKAIT